MSDTNLQNIFDNLDYDYISGNYDKDIESSDDIKMSHLFFNIINFERVRAFVKEDKNSNISLLMDINDDFDIYIIIIKCKF